MSEPSKLLEVGAREFGHRLVVVEGELATTFCSTTTTSESDDVWVNGRPKKLSHENLNAAKRSKMKINLFSYG